MTRLVATIASLLGQRADGASAASEIPIRLAGADYADGRAERWVRAAGFDQVLLWVVVGLLSFSLVMVYSASIALADNPRFGNLQTWHFVSRHAASILLGLLLAYQAFMMPMSFWEKHSRLLFVVALLLLVLVLVVGRSVNGATRWIPLGPINFQPSEFAKIAMVAYASGYMVRKMEVKEKFMQAILPMAIAVALVAGLLLLEPDLGALIVLTVIAFGILFLGGVNLRVMVVIGAFLLVSLGAVILASPWRFERALAFLQPFDERYALGKGYQLSHSLIAIGRGEIFGVGLGGSIEKLHWLPEGHTDFLLAVIGEEFGLLGVVALIFTFFWLTRRMMKIGRQAILLDQLFAGLVAQGVGLWIGFQALINFGVCLGVLPTKGLTLPFMSYGGSAILMNLVALAIVLRVDHENRQLMHGGRV
jgi:cell division protein FtsW